MAIRVTAKELRVFSTKRPMGPILFQDLGLQPANGVEKIDGNRPFEVISQKYYLTLMQMLFSLL